MAYSRELTTVLDASVPGGDTRQEAIFKNSDAIDDLYADVNTHESSVENHTDWPAGGVASNAGSYLKVDAGGTAYEFGLPTDIAADKTLSNLTSNATARTNLGLGSLAVINSPTPVANGGTGATTAATARTNLGLGTAAVENVVADEIAQNWQLGDCAFRESGDEIGQVPTLVDDGSGNAALPAVSGENLTGISTPSTNIASAVKTNTETFSIATGARSSAITGLQPSITPRAANSKLLIQGAISLGVGTDVTVGVTVQRDGSDAIVGDSAGSRQKITFAGSPSSSTSVETIPITLLVDAASTSATTFTVLLSQSDGVTRTVYVNRSSGDTDNNTYMRAVSTLTVTEIPQEA